MMEELVATLQGMGKVRSLPPTQRGKTSSTLSRVTHIPRLVSLSLPLSSSSACPRLCAGSCPRLCLTQLTLVHSVQVGSQVPDGAKFDIEVPADQPLTLANL